MALSVPSTPTVKTKTYENFKGVDYTNDQTNVWYRRSPSGVNMLPDASGRPFKRKGWEVLIPNSQICTWLEVAECEITKCYWFEISGEDHIAVFTNRGMFIYNGALKATNKDSDCFNSYDRASFFEGNGASAFYVYGNYKVWRYNADFTFEEVTDEVEIPTVLISTSADCAGTKHYDYNLLGHLASVEYNGCDLFTYWGTDGLIFSVNSTTFQSGKTKGSPSSYLYTYTNNAWSPSLDAAITVTGTPKNGDQIIVIWCNGFVLPNNVSQTQIDEVEVKTSVASKFDFDIDVIDETATLSTGKARIHTDLINRSIKTAWIEFYANDTWSQLVEGEDFIKAIFPSTEITITQYPITGHENDCIATSTGTLERG